MEWVGGRAVFSALVAIPCILDTIATKGIGDAGITVDNSCWVAVDLSMTSGPRAGCILHTRRGMKTC